MTLSVIIPFYCRTLATDGDPWSILQLIRCLDSVCDSARSNDYEVILVHDSDEPAACQRLQQLLQPYAYKALRLLQQPHQGAAATRNRGIREARGRWLWMIDADDCVVPGSIDLLLDLQQQWDDEAALVKLGDMLKGDNAYRAAAQHIKNTTFCPERRLALQLLLPRSSGLDHTTYLYRRSYLETTHLEYPTHLVLNEDCFFLLRCLAAAATVCVYPTLQLYRHDPQRHSITAGRWSRKQSRLYAHHSALFFDLFRQLCGDDFRSPFFPQGTLPPALRHNMRKTYDRYLYVYCRVLAVKGCPWQVIARFRATAGLTEGFYFLPHEADFKARCLAKPFINRLLNLFCRLIRH